MYAEATSAGRGESPSQDTDFPEDDAKKILTRCADPLLGALAARLLARKAAPRYRNWVLPGEPITPISRNLTGSS